MVGLFPESILNIPSEKWEQGLNCLVKSKEPFGLRKREENCRSQKRCEGLEFHMKSERW